MAAKSFLAFDLGASSGRSILGVLDAGRLSIRELSRFPNEMIEISGHLHWNIAQLYQELKRGLAACAAESIAPESIALDTWGVDFGLLAADGSLLGLPYAYRDSRHQTAPEEFFRLVPRRRVYELTGIQIMPINTLFQLYALARDESPLLKAADRVLMIPDLLNYFLTGEKKSEFTIASTSQLYNPRTRAWESDLLSPLGLSTAIMPEVLEPGTVIGGLREPIRRETGLGETPVVATASHDTGSAVAAAPAEGQGWAYISSGTWSLVGIESDQPIINNQALEANVTNEGGVGRTFRVLKNVTGLWLLQECRRAWARERSYSYEELARTALDAPAFRSFIDPDDPAFVNPPDMPEAIRRYCERTRQPQPQSPAEFARAIFEGLALKSRTVLDQLRGLSPKPIEVVHIIGGGSQNETLCQFTANAAALPVIAGPMEATAIGNLLVQAIGLGFLSSLAELRQVVRQSFPLKPYQPQQDASWDAAYQRFREVTAA
jgi:rhamnulokinase